MDLKILAIQLIVVADSMEYDALENLRSINPDKTYKINSVVFDIFKAKNLHSPEWINTLLRDAIKQVRTSYFRYGDISLLDDFDAKSQVYLCRVKYEKDDAVMEEWLSLRFVPGNGTPDSLEDFYNFLHNGEKIDVHIKNNLFLGDKDYLRQITAVSRICGLPTHSLNDHQNAEPYHLKYTSLIFTLLNYEFFSEHDEFKYVVGVFRDELLNKIFDLKSVGIDHCLQMPGAHILFNCQPDAIRQNRKSITYKYPGYFLNIFQVLRLFDKLINEGKLSLQSIKEHIQLYSPDWHAKFAGKKNSYILTQLRGIGGLLTVNGPVKGSLITGEELRCLIDEEVDDASELKMIHLSEWKQQINMAIHLLNKI